MAQLGTGPGAGPAGRLRVRGLHFRAQLRHLRLERLSLLEQIPHEELALAQAQAQPVPLLPRRVALGAEGLPVASVRVERGGRVRVGR